MSKVLPCLYPGWGNSLLSLPFVTLGPNSCPEIYGCSKIILPATKIYMVRIPDKYWYINAAFYEIPGNKAKNPLW